MLGTIRKNEHQGWASAPIGKTRHMPNLGISHLWNIKCIAANFYNLEFVSAKKVFYWAKIIVHLRSSEKNWFRWKLNKLIKAVV